MDILYSSRMAQYGSIDCLLLLNAVLGIIDIHVLSLALRTYAFCFVNPFKIINTFTFNSKRQRSSLFHVKPTPSSISVDDLILGSAVWYASNVIIFKMFA